MTGSDPRDLAAEEAEALLRRARPEPDADVIVAMEHRLLAAPVRRRHRRVRLAFAGLGFASVLAAVLVTAGLAGVQPWTAGDDRAGADQQCRTQTVTATTPEGKIVRGTDGRPRVVTTPQVTTREVTRCR
jgi:hypothetical protein